MFCDIMFWVVASELIKFDIKYPYMYHFGVSCNTCIWSLSMVFSMIVIEIMPHVLLLSSNIILSMLSFK